VEISEQLVITLTVAESTMEDAGEYAVRVYNEYGEVTSTTQVNIIFEAPTFTVPLTDQQVRQCATVTGHGRNVNIGVARILTACRRGVILKFGVLKGMGLRRGLSSHPRKFVSSLVWP